MYSVFLPFIYLSTCLVYSRRGKKEGTSSMNREILKQVFTKEILFGETLIIKARKTIAKS